MAQFPGKAEGRRPHPVSGWWTAALCRTVSDDVPALKPCGAVHVRRVAPVCAAAPYRVPLTGAWGRMRNRFVGRGILDASMAHSVRGRQGCRPLRWAKWMTPTVHPHRGRRRGPWPTARGCAICGWRFERQGISRRTRRGNFADCGQREFRLLRRATRGAASGLRDFLKKIE